MTKRTRRRKVIRTACYLCVLGSGAASIVWPPVSVTAATSPVRVLALVWSGLLVAGAVPALWGAATGKWVGEYIGLPPIIFAAGAFSVAALLAGRGWHAVAGALFLLSFGLKMLSRWQETAVLRAENVAAKKQDSASG